MVLSLLLKEASSGDKDEDWMISLNEAVKVKDPGKSQ